MFQTPGNLSVYVSMIKCLCAPAAGRKFNIQKFVSGLNLLKLNLYKKGTQNKTFNKQNITENPLHQNLIFINLARIAYDRIFGVKGQVANSIQALNPACVLVLVELCDKCNIVDPGL